MASKNLRRVGLPVELCSRLAKQHVVTCQEFLTLSSLDLLRMTGRSYEDFPQLMMTISKHCCPKTTTALENKKQHKQQSAFLPTSLASLDNALCGGLACGSVTEVSGPPGCGKTQLCMMLSVLATLPKRMGGLDSPVIYIDTEGAFSSLRLIEIAQRRYSEYFACQKRLLEMTSRVHLYREFSTQHIMDRLQVLEESLVETGAQFVVLDSVASAVRQEFDSRLPFSLVQRSKFLGQQAAFLKYLAEEFCIPILLTNQITVKFNDRPTSTLETTEEPSVEESFVTTALGTTWGHSANTRLVLQFLNTQQRQIRVAKSPVAPNMDFSYTVQSSGIVLDGD
uniref:DNA repair protein RAD51 homolog 2 n=1 Tax=Eptatretus burgeri TaxID=7764 RepID=A0A8C4WWH6_EPTBU